MTLLEHWEKRGEKRGQYLVKTKTRIRLLSSAFPEFSPADADRVCQAEEAHNFHHLIPRTLHSNKWFKRRYTRQEMQAGLEVCKSCHSAIHNLIPDEKELGRNYPTREKLLSHPQIAKYVLWKQKRSPSC